MIMTSLNAIKSYNPCLYGWANLLFGRGKISKEELDSVLNYDVGIQLFDSRSDDEKFPLSMALESNSLSDVLWACRFLHDHSKMIKKYAVWCARQVEHLSTNPHTKELLDTSSLYIDGIKTLEELNTVRKNHRNDADAAAYAADDADAYAADAADAAYDAAAYAADAAYDAAAYAADAADAAYDAYDAAYAARKQAVELQKAKLKQILDAGYWVE